MSDAAAALLGGARVRVGGAWRPLAPDRRGQLLAYLACAGRRVERDRLADLLWRDLPLDAARRNLRHLVHTIGRADFVPGLTATRETLGWAVACDVRELEAALDRGDVAAANALYRGPLLPGFEERAGGGYAAWLEVEREHLRLRWRAVVLAWAREARADADAVLGALRQLVEDDLDEEALLVTLDALERSGQRARAAAVLERFRQRVRATFGVEINLELRTRAERLRATEATASTRSLGGVWSGSPFVGRDPEVATLRRWLEDGERRVTVVGPGGVGKSRLVDVALVPWLGRRGRVLAVAASGLTRPSELAAAIARAAGALVEPDEPIDGVLARVLDDDVAGLVIDDAERDDALAPVVTAVARLRPALPVVVTAPAPLRDPGERVLPLAGLDHGEGRAMPPERARALPAVALFEALAARQQPGFALRDDDLDTVRAIAAAVDGSPLGLELAAPWARSLPLAELAAQVVGDPGFLSAPARPATRQRSLRAAFEHAAGLLSTAERAALVRLAVFPAPFALGAALAVADVALPVLASLVDRSLVRVGPDGRYVLPAPVRAFARGALAADAATEGAVLTRLVAHALGLVGEDFPDDGFPSAAAVARLEREGALLDAAWNAAATSARHADLVRLTTAIATTWELRGRLTEAHALVERAATLLPGGDRRWRRARGRLLARGAWLLHWHQPERAAACAAEARAVLPPSDAIGGAWVLRTLAMAAWRAGAYDIAETHARAALARIARSGPARWRAVLLDGLGLCLAARGAFGAAEAAFREALDLNDRFGDPFQATQNLINLASQARGRGDARTAVAYAQRAVALARELGYAQYVPHALVQLAACALAAGDADRAEGASAEADLAALRTGDTYVRIWSHLVRAEVRAAQGRPAAAAALAHGLDAALAAHDRKQLLRGVALAARFALDRHDPVTAAWALAAARSSGALPAVVRAEVTGLRSRLAALLPAGERRSVAHRVRALGLDGAVRELRVRVGAWEDAG